jgi:hypothetical protein
MSKAGERHHDRALVKSKHRVAGESKRRNRASQPRSEYGHQLKYGISQTRVIFSSSSACMQIIRSEESWSQCNLKQSLCKSWGHAIRISRIEAIVSSSSLKRFRVVLRGCLVADHPAVVVGPSPDTRAQRMLDIHRLTCIKRCHFEGVR